MTDFFTNFKKITKKNVNYIHLEVTTLLKYQSVSSPISKISTQDRYFEIGLGSDIQVITYLETCQLVGWSDGGPAIILGCRAVIPVTRRPRNSTPGSCRDQQDKNSPLNHHAPRVVIYVGGNNCLIPRKKFLANELAGSQGSEFILPRLCVPWPGLLQKRSASPLRCHRLDPLTTWSVLKNR